MSKYRKRPIVVDAVKATERTVIKTLEGDTATAQVGDWIITGIRGEQYPCNAEVFEETYVLATQPTGGVAELLKALKGLVSAADPDTPEVCEHLRLTAELRTAVAALQSRNEFLEMALKGASTSEADAWGLVQDMLKCPACGGAKEVDISDFGAIIPKGTMDICPCCEGDNYEPDMFGDTAVKARKALEERT